MGIRVFEPSINREQLDCQPLEAFRMSCGADGLEVTPAQIGRIPFQSIEALSVFESRPRGAPAYYLMVFSRGQRRPFVIEIGNIDYAGFQALASIPAGMEKFRRLVILLGQGAATDTLVDKDTGAFLQTGQVLKIRKLVQTPLALATAFATHLAAKRKRVQSPESPESPEAPAAPVAPQVQPVPQVRTSSPALAAPQAQAVSPALAAPQAQVAFTASPVARAPAAAADRERPIQRLQPGFVRILSSDYASALSLIFVSIGWLIVILAANGITLRRRSWSQSAVSGPATDFLPWAVLATVVFLPLCFFRVQSIARVFETLAMD